MPENVQDTTQPAEETFTEYRKKLIEQQQASGEKSATQKLIEEINSSRNLTADDYNIIVR